LGIEELSSIPNTTRSIYNTTIKGWLWLLPFSSGSGIGSSLISSSLQCSSLSSS